MNNLAVVKTIAEVRAWRRALNREGKRMALVPTMGFLHDGHLSLMREGRKHADAVGVSIFVNPTQFGPKEDLSSYPRDLEGDVRKCESAGAALVFAPDVGEVYSQHAETIVEVQSVSHGLCGERRPGHFRGVATVVAKLLGIFQPDVALFGEKDFQQLQVIRAMVRDLNIPCDIIGLPIVRESDGLAMSSRNSYLSAENRARALALSKGLFEAQRLAKAGTVDAAALTAAVRAQLQKSALREDYVELVDAETLKPISALQSQRANRLLVAAFAGTTRLIDNLAI